MSTLNVSNLKGNPNNNTITVATGHKIVGSDVGSVYSPGSVIQVQQSTFSTFISTTSTSWATIFSTNITPKFSNSLILIQAKIPAFTQHSGTLTAIGGGFRIMRGATIVDGNSGDGGGALGIWRNDSGLSGTGYRDLFTTIVQYSPDFPNTISQVTYDLQWINRAGTLYVNYSASTSPKCVMTATEIAQ